MNPEDLKADPDFQKLSPEAQQIVLARVGQNAISERYPAAGMRSQGGIEPLRDALGGEGGMESYYPAAGMRAQGALERGRPAAANIVRIAGSLPPGPLGMATSAGGSLLADAIEGQSPDLKRAGEQAALTGVLGGLGWLAKPLSKLRVAGMGQAADAKLAADAVRGAGTSLQPGNTTADLMNVMRGKPGEEALGAAREASQQAVARQLPLAPTRIDKGTRSYLDAEVAGQAPRDPAMPALSREDYLTASEELKRLGRRGFNIRGLMRDSPEAVAARELHGERLGDLKSKLEQQGGPGLLGQEEAGRGDFSAGTELRRLFRPNTGEGPDRVFRPGGFNLQDLQERAAKRVPEIQGRLGQAEGDEFLRRLFRGGSPGEGTDRPLQIGFGKFKGLGFPLGLKILAGPPTDPRFIQALLQSGAPSLLDALRQ